MALQRRHAPVSRRRRTTGTGLQAPKRDGTAAPRRATRRPSHDLLAHDHADHRRSGRFRWFLSTCLAAGIGAFAILFVILGARDTADLTTIVMPPTDTGPIQALPEARRTQGLAWAIPKSDRLIATTGALSTRFVIQESFRQRRDNREYLQKKSYARVIGRLPVAPAPTDADQIPPFNPYKLYAAPNGAENEQTPAIGDTQDATVKVTDLFGSLLPSDDGQEMEPREVADAVARASQPAEDPTAIRAGFAADGIEKLNPQDLLAQRSQRAARGTVPPNTTELAKTGNDSDDALEDLEAREVRVVKAARGETLTRILDRLAGETWQKRAIVEAARTHIADNGLQPDQEIHVTLVPSLTRQGRSDPVRLSIFGEGHEHKVTIAQNSAGEFMATTSPIDERLTRAAANIDETKQTSSLYNSIYVTALSQGIGQDVIQNVLRVHANSTDYRRRARGGDQFDFFFDVKDEDKRPGGALGELLASILTIGGETQKFYRFRTPDGVVDYYDEAGNTSRQFLMRRPVRGDNLRLASGFGMRRHPLLNTYRMHAGIDYAGPVGTPIMAAGAGTIEEAGRKGEYGNHIRIRHANGYRTTYSHMSRFASGISEGARVTQGQVIGFIGNTGLSTGPHLHFEVTINNQHFDPLTIQVPKDRRLTGKHLVDFQKERVRIDELMRRNPVSTQVVEAAQAR
ncbi:MAG: M23 family metallopeptidase [Hyphomicrobiaceae bacterium]